MAERRGALAIGVLVLLLVAGAVIGLALRPPTARPAPEEVPQLAWAAPVLFVLALMWVAIGAVAARTRLVGKPGAAAARATWLSSTRPWRARESTLGLLPLDRWLIFLVPVALLVATRMLQTALQGWVHLALVVAAWSVFALVLRAAVGRRSPWPVIAAVGGVVVLRCLLTLAALSVTDHQGFSDGFWLQPALRSAFVAVAFALFVWTFIAAGWALKVQGGTRYALGGLLAALGAGLALPALGVAVAGADDVVAHWDDGLGLVPHSLVETMHLAAVGPLAWAAVAIGAVLAVVGVLVIGVHRRDVSDR